MAPGSIVASFESLPARYLGDPEGKLKAHFRLRVGSAVRDVHVTPDACTVKRAHGHPDAEISTSPSTWLEIDGGHLSGIEAFASRRLRLRGSIQQAIRFEPLFERPDAGALRYQVRSTRYGTSSISAVVAGDEAAPPLLLLHGLGGTKASFLPIVPALAARFRVIALDLPGFGMSSKPRGRYDASWFAEHVFAYMDELGYGHTYLAGNSMGGRIAQEMALKAPERVDGIACLCPATAFSRRPGLAMVRLLLPEMGFFIGTIPRFRIKSMLKDMFAKPSRLDESWYEAAVDDFRRTWRSPRARMAFFAAARNIYLDEPHGERGFWTRLQALQPPSLYIFGWQDPLITPHFAKKVRRFVPDARVEVWNDCGHVPQIEHPQRTADSLISSFGAPHASEQREAAGA